MADTALTLITDALLDLEVLGDEETPSASMAQGGLRKLNNLIDSWNIESLMVYGATSYVLPLVAGQGTYTIGTGGNLNIPRPDNVQSVFLRDTTQPIANRLDIPLYMFSDQEWQNVGFKTMQSAYPFNGVWINYAYPLLQAYFNPVPSSSQYSAVFWVPGNIGNLALNDVISLAPGYKRALTANLAIDLAPSYGVEIPAALAKVASDSKRLLKIQNVETTEMGLPRGLGGGWFDYRTGYVR